MDWNKDEDRDIKFILKRLDTELDRVWAICQSLLELNIPEVNAMATDIVETLDSYRVYTKGYIEAVDKTKAINKNLKVMNISLNSEVKELRAENERLNSQMEILFNGYSDNISILGETLRAIKDNAKTMEMKEYMKDKSINKHGANSPRYRKDINDDELVSLYQSGWTIKKLADKYNMSSPGMMSRLKALGVYKQTYGG